MAEKAYIMESPEVYLISMDETSKSIVPFNEIPLFLSDVGYKLKGVPINHCLVDAKMPLTAFSAYLLEGYDPQREGFVSLADQEELKTIISLEQELANVNTRSIESQGYRDGPQIRQELAKLNGFRHQTNIRYPCGAEEGILGSVLGYPSSQFANQRSKRLNGMVSKYISSEKFEPPYFAVTHPEFLCEVIHAFANVGCAVSMVGKEN